MDKFKLLEELRNICNNEKNIKKFKEGFIEGEIEVIVVDIIKNNFYFDINDYFIDDFNKIIIKNQEINKTIYIYLENLSSYTISDNKMVFYMKDNNIIDINF